MKKNLRNLLAVGLGLITTVAFAQTWDVDSRTRMDMSDANGDGNQVKSTDQRVTLSADWEGEGYNIHVSSDVNYTLGAYSDVSMSIYEAYATADFMGATFGAGRVALNMGSGALMSSNDWAAKRTTWEGLGFNYNMEGTADIWVGYHRQNDGSGADDAGNMWLNAGGEMSGWNWNFLYMTEEGIDNSATGIDVNGEVMGAGVMVSMNTDFNENTMRMIGLSYSAMDNMTINVAQTVYGEDGDFHMHGTSMDGSYGVTGNLGYLSAGSENLSYGLDYNMGDFTLGATMHNITNTLDENVDRSITEISLGYSINDNAGLSVFMANEDDVQYMYMTLNVGL